MPPSRSPTEGFQTTPSMTAQAPDPQTTKSIRSDPLIGNWKPNALDVLTHQWPGAPWFDGRLHTNNTRRRHGVDKPTVLADDERSCGASRRHAYYDTGGPVDPRPPDVEWIRVDGLPPAMPKGKCRRRPLAPLPRDSGRSPSSALGWAVEAVLREAVVGCAVAQSCSRSALCACFETLFSGYTIEFEPPRSRSFQ